MTSIRRLLRIHGNRLGRAVVAWSCIAAFLIASLGVMPSPAWLAQMGLASASQERYPCEACGCGCASARECWLHCCCHSLEERIAWARANDVTIPAYVVIPAQLKYEVAHSLPACCSAEAHQLEGHADVVCRTLPRKSAFTCKGIARWMAVASLKLLEKRWAGVLPRLPLARCFVPCDEQSPTPPAIDTPTPPPRAIAAT